MCSVLQCALFLLAVCGLSAHALEVIGQTFASAVSGIQDPVKTFEKATYQGLREEGYVDTKHSQSSKGKAEYTVKRSIGPAGFSSFAGAAHFECKLDFELFPGETSERVSMECSQEYALRFKLASPGFARVHIQASSTANGLAQLQQLGYLQAFNGEIRNGEAQAEGVVSGERTWVFNARETLTTRLRSGYEKHALFSVRWSLAMGSYRADGGDAVRLVGELRTVEEGGNVFYQLGPDRTASTELLPLVPKASYRVSGRARSSRGSAVAMEVEVLSYDQDGFLLAKVMTVASGEVHGEWVAFSRVLDAAVITPVAVFAAVRIAETGTPTGLQFDDLALETLEPLG